MSMVVCCGVCQYAQGVTLAVMKTPPELHPLLFLEIIYDIFTVLVQQN